MMPAKKPFPAEATRAFQMHRWNARRRDIPFLFTIEEWWAWWQTDDRWSKRGMGASALVMARKGDVGPYAPDNVYVATHVENLTRAPHEDVAKAHASGYEHGWRLSRTGSGHPRSKAVMTPQGRFENATIAAKAHGITRQAAAQRARLGIEGWFYTTYYYRPARDSHESGAPVKIP